MNVPTGIVVLVHLSFGPRGVAAQQWSLLRAGSR
jgi:hypothetical protein